MFSVHKIIECICIRTYTTKFFLENYYFIKKKNIYIYIYTRKGNTTIIEAPFLGSGCGRVV